MFKVHGLRFKVQDQKLGVHDLGSRLSAQYLKPSPLTKFVKVFLCQLYLRLDHGLDRVRTM